MLQLCLLSTVLPPGQNSGVLVSTAASQLEGARFKSTGQVDCSVDCACSPRAQTLNNREKKSWIDVVTPDIQLRAYIWIKVTASTILLPPSGLEFKCSTNLTQK